MGFHPKIVDLPLSNFIADARGKDIEGVRVQSKMPGSLNSRRSRGCGFGAVSSAAKKAFQ
jgi:hypothetical protein